MNIHNGRRHGDDLEYRAKRILPLRGPVEQWLVGDIGKGFLPVWWAQALVSPGVSPWVHGYLAVVGLCALAGHLYPVFLKFRTGGRGVATAAGCLLAISPGALGVSGLVFVMTACGLNRVSAASLAASLLRASDGHAAANKSHKYVAFLASASNLCPD